MSEQYSQISKEEFEKVAEFYKEMSLEELQSSLNGIHTGGSEENPTDIFDILVIEALIKIKQGQ